MAEGKDKKRKDILWLHNFPKKTGAGGGWMYNQYEFLKEEVDLYYLDNLRNPFRFLQHLYRLRQLSKKYKIVHAQYGSAVGFLTSLMNCTRILSLKGSDWYGSPNPSTRHKIRVLLGRILTDFSINRCHQIIVMSNAMKREVNQRFPHVNVQVVVDPIDLNRFKPLPGSRENKIKKVLFAAVDIDKPVKRFPLALKSYELLHERMLDTQLIKMSKIPHEEVNGFMNNVDVLLLTSTHEGWPNVVKEMLACNKPFVSTRVSDLEVIASRTKSCFTCADNPEELAKGLQKALLAQKEDLRHLVKDFSMDKSLACIRNIYSKYI